MLLEQEKKKKGINKLFVVGFIIGALMIGAVLWTLARKPSMDDQKANILQGAYAEGSQEFQQLNKDIIISTDTERTVESPMAAGTISMFIHGNIRNKGPKAITILEINAAVVTQFKTVLREKRVLVVPVQLARLEPGQTVPVTLTMDGFSRDDDRADIRWKVTAIKAE
jgi:TRAP-type C4-dicarboxylate transport system permease large subunit